MRVWDDLPTDCDVQSLSIDIEQEAVRDACGIGRLQRYVLYAYRTESKKEASSRLTFNVDGQAESEENESEPPTAKGQLAQLMRHNEALAKMVVGQSVQTTESQARMTARLMESFSQQMEAARNGGRCW